MTPSRSSLNAASMHHHVQQEYERLAAIYDQRWSRYIAMTLNAVMEVVKLDRQMRVLDVACGTGELERRLLERQPDLDIVGTDLSAPMLRLARAKLPHSATAWIQADATWLPLADSLFDLVVCANSFHYFAQPVEALQEMRRVLHSNGVFILVDWCDDYLACKLCSIWLRWTRRAFYRTYSARACRSMLEEAGFTVQKMDRFRVGWIWGLMRFVCIRRPEPEMPAIVAATAQRVSRTG
ncbi:MAG: SAM-dependent methyltransferase [Pirellulaceae bacterium]|nr:MAG: SAM-dependent methyltransferase [Pirellulaceae bacterium]